MIPEYYRLLREAQQASDEVDNFDLRSKDPESVKAFALLEEASDKAQAALSLHVRENPFLFPDERFSIYLIKATRKPTFVRHISKDGAMAAMDELGRSINALQAASLAASGISIHLVHSMYDEQIANIKIGGLEFHGVPVIFKYFGF